MPVARDDARSPRRGNAALYLVRCTGTCPSVSRIYTVIVTRLAAVHTQHSFPICRVHTPRPEPSPRCTYTTAVFCWVYVHQGGQPFGGCTYTTGLSTFVGCSYPSLVTHLSGVRTPRCVYPRQSTSTSRSVPLSTCKRPPIYSHVHLVLSLQDTVERTLVSISVFDLDSLPA